MKVINKVIFVGIEKMWEILANHATTGNTESKLSKPERSWPASASRSTSS